jgi:DNA mismatch repair ATPase MutS
LEHILLHPTNDQKELERRLGHIPWFLDHDQEAETTHSTLKQLVDIPKIMSLLLYKKLSALGFAKLRSTLEIALDPLLPVAEGLEMI